jgi:pimeloyl-ACP methyl ester carboxylesterase
MLDTTMALGDGRVLAYTDLGVADGPLVFYFHGAPSSRLDLVPFDRAFTDQGVRIVSPDRPGYGGSSPQPGRELHDWPTDVAALANHLGRNRFAVMGLSSGGPYVVACAALLPERVAAAAVIAGVTDVSWPGYFNDYGQVWIDIMRAGGEAKAKQWCDEHLGPDGSGLMEHDLHMCPADEAFLADPEVGPALLASMQEAFRQGTGGFAQDLTIENQPWTFDPTSITVPVRVLHGEDDSLLPLGHSRHTAEVIAGAVLDLLPEHGHVSILRELPRVVDELVASLR